MQRIHGLFARPPEFVLQSLDDLVLGRCSVLVDVKFVEDLHELFLGVRHGGSVDCFVAVTSFTSQTGCLADAAAEANGFVLSVAGGL